MTAYPPQLKGRNLFIKYIIMNSREMIVCVDSAYKVIEI